MAAKAFLLLRRLGPQLVGAQWASKGPTLLANTRVINLQVLRALSFKDDGGRASVARNVETDSASSSDSDSDRKTEKGTTDFWRQKMRTVHAIFDLNKDGVISWDDFGMLGDRFIDLGHLTPEQETGFRKTLKSIWEEQWGPADPYNMVNAYQYLDNMHHVINDKSLKKKAHRFLPFLFKAVDKDRSGEISVEEYKLFFRCLGLKEEEAVVAFRAIDYNNDNRLSLKEFVKVGREFFSSEDEKKPSKHFWGPLIQDH
ncbi:sarcoplasmic calcium-binding protein [Neocloeon triangulifer]|uniref:sarcoplasmic calcium-binding protein n=1 Tax=Neocloeon triangulifer TaxID=2078957 RepID=UPI00286F027E|nr:sarcoplasmic calcium-binding protein [Neocloeon triangulifer]